MVSTTLIQQTAGGSLKFRSESSMGFTKGSNYVCVEVSNYSPNNTYINLKFYESQPSQMAGPMFTTSFLSAISNVETEGALTVNEAIAIEAEAEAIKHLKAFNSTSAFESAEFAPAVTPSMI
jgi:hypothetical protein